MFYIIQMGDFHFGGTHPGKESEKDILKRMTKKIRTEIPPGTKVILCACGDYIDSQPVLDGTTKRNLTEGEVLSRYQVARETLLSSVIEPLKKEYDFEVGLCMGNHDTTHVEAVNQFSQAIIGREINETYSLNISSENVDFIFVNSCPLSDHSHGEIDYDHLEKILRQLSPDSTKYLVLHHTLMSMDERDASSIRQVPRLIKLIDKYTIKAVFHGHTHGQYVIRVGNVGCPIIGVGAVFVRDYPNVNSQFNLICCNNGLPIFANNYQYHADWAMNPESDGLEKISVSISKENNFFSGKTFSKVYNELIRMVQAESKLYHVHLHVRSSFDVFSSDVEENFGNKVELETLDRQYSYTQLAQMWEAPQLDQDVLYFNHGIHFSTEEYPSGIDCIIHEIGGKKTSSRAVLVTVNTKDISKTAPDALLPSLLSIQASFDPDQTTLHITMNLRALEASRFLKINICEILLLAQKIYEKYPFTNIEVEISAFRVQIIDQFGCFLKAKLDTLAQNNKIAVRLSCLIYSDDKTKIVNEIDKIISLIRDKQLRSETVIETVGVERLLSSIRDVKEDMPAGKEVLKSTLEKIYTYTHDLLIMLNSLKENRARSSEQTENMANLGKDIETQYDLLIKEFERLKET